MKVAHFGVFAPHTSGQYATIKDLILAERKVGLDAQFIDCGYNKNMVSRVGLQDGEIVTVPVAWANDADIVMRHSVIPNAILDAKPAILALHGRPAAVAQHELVGMSKLLSYILTTAKAGKYEAYVTFWPEHLFYWSRLLVDKKLFYIPAPVDFDFFTPEGKKHIFKHNGTPNIVVADRWGVDEPLFNLFFAAQYFKENYYKDAKLHIYGAPPNNTSINYLSPLKRLGLIGELCGRVLNLPEIYRSADMLLTPHIIATRTIREASACGLPIVAPHSCKFTAHPAEARDYKTFALAMKECYEANYERQAVRKQILNTLSLESTGRAAKALYQKVKDDEVENSFGKQDLRVLERRKDVKFKEDVYSNAAP